MYAAGLTLTEENYPKFKQKFEEVVSEQIDEKLLTPELLIDAELSFTEIDEKFHRILKQFEPFGPKNLAPVFLSKKVKDSGYAKTVGADNKHLKCFMKQQYTSHQFGGIGFNVGNKLNLLKESTVSVAYNLDENEWNGKCSLQLRIKDIKPD